MKTKLIIFFLLLFAVTTAFAQSSFVTANIKVYGNCTMCKDRIETALDQKGIKKAVWDRKSKNLEVTYNSSKITEAEIHKIVASVGHDTDLEKADVEVYSKLPYCCLYRDGVMEENPDHELHK